jgi:hypothetical protein
MTCVEFVAKLERTMAIRTISSRLRGFLSLLLRVLRPDKNPLENEV